MRNPRFNPASNRPKGFFWRVVNDPTRKGDEPGLFFGSCFRLIRIHLGKREPLKWTARNRV
jgi:hypothetical protein